MEREAHRYWFRAKRYGFGWTPSGWRGWAAVAVWAAVFGALIAGASIAAAASAVLAAAFAGLAVVVTALLAWVTWRRGEPARWRWGRGGGWGAGGMGEGGEGCGWCAG